MFSFSLLLWAAIFVLSLFILVQASDYFTDAAERLGIFLGFHPFIIGVTIVAIGTSLPELASSIAAVLQQSSEIVLGNVVGSNITNIFLIVGVASAMSRKFKITYNSLKVDLQIFLSSAFLLCLAVGDRDFSAGDAWLSLGGFVIYILYAVLSHPNNLETSGESSERDPEEDTAEDTASGLEKPDRFPVKSLAIAIVSLIFIWGSAEYTIESVTKISEFLQIGKEVIAIGAVAFGTSLPELIVTIVATRKGNPEMAVGNVLGSNIFNCFAVMGVAGAIDNLEIAPVIIAEGLPAMLAGTILFFLTTQNKQFSRWEGLLFFVFYGWFIGEIFDVL